MIRRSTTLAIASLLTAVGTAPASAQRVGSSVYLISYGALSVGAIVSLASRNKPPKIGVGTRLKVRLHGVADWSNPVRIFRIDADSMLVEADSGVWRFARSEIDSLQVKASTGRWAEGWAIGLVSGGVIGGLIGYTATSSGGDDFFTPGEAAVVGGIVLGTGGSVLGAGIGLLAPSRWVTVSDSKGYRVSIAPTFVRPGFVARLQF